jgi:DNA-binding response OmpR family regulator
MLNIRSRKSHAVVRNDDEMPAFLIARLNTPVIFRRQTRSIFLQLGEPDMQRRILIIEDNIDIADKLSVHLRDAGFLVTIARDGNSGLHLGRESRWDLVLLELRLPGMNGLDLCKALRATNSRVPIVLLTSQSTEFDRVLGLELGADDFVTKPLCLAELTARVKAVLRRVAVTPREQPADDTVLVVDDIRIDSLSHTASVGEQPIDLTLREFVLLTHFLRHPGRVFRRSELLKSVWGYAHDGYEHTVNSHINRLRAKIEPDPAQPERIVTVWGVGYKFVSKREATVVTAVA